MAFQENTSRILMLRDWQKVPAERLLAILRAGGNAVDLSDTGTGKSYVSCYVSATLGENTLAVVPKIAVSMWHSVAESFGAPLQAIGYEAIRTGKTNYGRWEHQRFAAEEFFLCESCQCKVDFDDYRPCHCHPAGLHCIKTKKKPHRYGKFIWAPEVKFLIFDEIHRCSGLDSLNADMLIAAKRQGIRILGLSATAACEPLKMRALGYALDLHGLNQTLMKTRRMASSDFDFNDPVKFYRNHETIPDFYQWARGYDCRPDPVYRGLRWFASAERQKTIMADIHSKLIPERGVRVRTAGIPGFPERLITAELFDLEKDYEIEKLYREMAKTPERAPENAADELPIVQQLRCRMRLEFFKIPIAVELCEDAQAKGLAVAIFCSFKDTIAELRKRLNCDCIIDGSQSAEERQRCIDDFQSDRQQIILVNSKAGGVAVSLHDLCGRSRLGILFPSFSAIEYLQVLGRLHRDGALSPAIYKVVLVARTIEEKIKKALDRKLNNLSALNDGDLMPT